jgi:hypothetical protein
MTKKPCDTQERLVTYGEGLVLIQGLLFDQKLSTKNLIWFPLGTRRIPDRLQKCV